MARRFPIPGRAARAPRESLRALAAAGASAVFPLLAGCHPDHASFCATFSSGTGTHVTVTDGDFHCPTPRTHAIEGEGDGRFAGWEEGQLDGRVAGHAEGFTAGVDDARDGVIAHPEVPLCCLARPPGPPAPPESRLDDLGEESPVYRDAYRDGFRAAYDEAFAEGFTEAYGNSYADGYRYGEG